MREKRMKEKDKLIHKLLYEKAHKQHMKTSTRMRETNDKDKNIVQLVVRLRVFGTNVAYIFSRLEDILNTTSEMLYIRCSFDTKNIDIISFEHFSHSIRATFQPALCHAEGT